jgi:hypothetical protein
LQKDSVSVLATIALTAVTWVGRSTVSLVGHDDLIITQQMSVHLNRRLRVLTTTRLEINQLLKPLLLHALELLASLIVVK